MKIEDPVILKSVAHDEYASPSPQKVTADRTIYLSRNDFGHLLKPTGVVQISDFGLSVSGKTQQTGCIQAEPYRAPEVILDAGYSYSADIWSLGVLVRRYLITRYKLADRSQRIVADMGATRRYKAV